MTAVYPTSVRTYTPRTDLSDTVEAIDVNSLQEEITAIQTAIGTNPALSTSGGTGNYSSSASTYPTLSARIANLEKGLVALGTKATDSAVAHKASVETINGVWTFATNPIFLAQAIPVGALQNTMPRGKIGNPKTTAATNLSTVVGTETTLATSDTFTPSSNRTYKVSFSERFGAGAVGALISLRVRSSAVGTPLVGSAQIEFQDTGGPGTQTITGFFTFNAGDAGFAVGTPISLSLVATATAFSSPASSAVGAGTLLIEDIGGF